MTFVKGTCTEMCPVLERRGRERERLLHRFEILEGTECLQRPQADLNKTIKEFRRSAAGRNESQPEDIRTPDTLIKTMHYMMKNVMQQEDVPWTVIYDFMFDRIRAVRQDLTFQQLNDHDNIHILALAVRFYIYSGYRLIDEPASNFDSHINSTHLQDCLKQLMVLYHMISTSSWQVEMTSYYLLHNLGSLEALAYVLQLPRKIRQQEQLQTSIQLSFSKLHKNYARFFKLIPKLHSLQACALVQHIKEMQILALQLMNIAFSSANSKYPLIKLVKLLFFDNEEMAHLFCSQHGIEVTDKCARFYKRTNQPLEASNSTRKLSFIDHKLEDEDPLRLIIVA